MSIKRSDDFDRFFNCKQYPKTQVLSTRRLLWWDAPVINLEANLPAVGSLSRMLFRLKISSINRGAFQLISSKYHLSSRKPFCVIYQNLNERAVAEKKVAAASSSSIVSNKINPKEARLSLTSRSLILDSINFHVASAPHNTKRAYKVCRLPKQTSWTL